VLKAGEGGGEMVDGEGERVRVSWCVCVPKQVTSCTGLLREREVGGRGCPLTGSLPRGVVGCAWRWKKRYTHTHSHTHAQTHTRMAMEKRCDSDERRRRHTDIEIDSFVAFFS
jgi:hypothetical protein